MSLNCQSIPKIRAAAARVERRPPLSLSIYMYICIYIYIYIYPRLARACRLGPAPPPPMPPRRTRGPYVGVVAMFVTTASPETLNGTILGVTCLGGQRTSCTQNRTA